MSSESDATSSMSTNNTDPSGSNTNQTLSTNNTEQSSNESSQSTTLEAEEAKDQVVNKPAVTTATETHVQQGAAEQVSFGKAAEVPVENQKATQERLDELELEYGAYHVVLLFKPVGLSMLFALFITKVIEELRPEGRKEVMFTILFDESRGSTSTGSGPGDTTINVALFIGVICAATFILVFCVIKCFYCLTIYIIIAFTWMNIIVVGFLIKGSFTALNVPIDYISALVFLYNYSVVTMLATFWKGPLIIEQVFLVVNCTCLSCVLNRILPEATVWVFLIALVFWDLFAVLAPCGPLRLMINHMKDTDREFGKGLVYTAGIVGFEPGTVTKPKPSRAKAGAEPEQSKEEIKVNMNEESKVANAESSPVEETDQQKTCEEEANCGFEQAKETIKVEEDYEEGTIKLGLGDFIFYSLLITRTSQHSSMVTVIACFVSVLVGLGITLVALAIYKKALPALPISLLLALAFRFIGDWAMAPFLNNLAFNQIII